MRSRLIVSAAGVEVGVVSLGFEVLNGNRLDLVHRLLFHEFLLELLLQLRADDVAYCLAVSCSAVARLAEPLFDLDGGANHLRCSVCGLVESNGRSSIVHVHRQYIRPWLVSMADGRGEHCRLVAKALLVLTCLSHDLHPFLRPRGAVRAAG